MSTMNICKVDEDNKWTGITKVVSSKMLLPKRWVIIDPPVLEQNQEAVFNGTSWDINNI